MKARRPATLWHETTPWLVLACGIATTIAVTAIVSWAARQQAQIRFASAVAATQTAIQTRIETYRALLRATAGLLAANENLTRAEFARFATRLSLTTNYPGVQGIGFSRKVGTNEVDEVLARARSDGLTNVTLWPEQSGAERHAILFLEPLDERNRAALGFDMTSEPVRRAAMFGARDAGHAMASGKVILKQEISPAKQAGFLIYAPVYRGGLIPSTIKERREKILGFAYAPFRADDLFAGIFPDRTEGDIEFEVYDGPVRTEEALLHKSAPKHFSKAQRQEVPVIVVGRTWTLEFYSTEAFEHTALRTLAPVSGVLGCLVTTLLWTATLAQKRAHDEAARQQQLETQRAALRADVGVALTRTTASVHDLLQECTDAIVKYLPAAFARIWLIEPETNTLVLRASSGLYTHIDGPHSRVPVGKLKIGLIAAEAKPHLTNDVLKDPRLGDPEWARREGMVAFAGYPLLVEGRVIGVIAMFARQTLDRQFLEAIAGIADVIAQGLQRRQAEEALRIAQEKLRQHAGELERSVAERTQTLQETVKSLESFSYSIAHDLRAPLRTIHSFAALLLDEHGPKLDESGQDFARRIVAAATRMDDLIQDLLAYNRLTREELPLQRVDLTPTLQAVLDHVRADITSRHAEIAIDPPMPSVMANKTLLQQVITNLLTNALKFVKPGVPPKVRIWTELHGNRVRFLVSDNGIGIEEAHHGRIFGVFERLHSGAVYPGTGIGLAIVYKAIERMNGTVGVDSTPGEGSTFWFELPRG